MSRARRVLFAIALSIICVSVLSLGTFFRAEAGDVRRGKTKTKTVVSQKSAVSGFVEPRISEIDADTPGTDVAEFVEISAEPGASLDGFVLVFYTGSSDTSYAAIDLDGLVVDSNGLVLLGNSGVPGVDRVFADGLLQNGPDAVAIYAGNNTDFPNGTAATTANLVDALVYDTADADDPGLLALLNPGLAQVQIDEASAPGGSEANGIQRCLPGARDGRAFTVRPPTPNVPNLTCQDTNVDMNGDRRTDFLITRDSGFSFTSFSARDFPKSNRQRRAFQKEMGSQLQAGTFPIEWAGVNNQAPGGTNVAWGDSGLIDVVVSADFDGDGSDDVAIWRPGPESEASFYSINSSDFTIRISNFGQDGDDPAVVGDYDGDGIDDDAVYRCPEGAPGTCHYLLRLSADPPGSVIKEIPWGTGQIGDFFAYPGDFDGDGKHDFCIQGASEIDPQIGIFQLFLSKTLTNETVSWGFSSDFLVPGDYDGDGRTDFCVLRQEFGTPGTSDFYILERDGGVRVVSWGFDSDFPAPGDYDGDGRQDIAVYRWNTSDATFWILPSSGAAPWTFTYGGPGDFPVASWFVQ